MRAWTAIALSTALVAGTAHAVECERVTMVSTPAAVHRTPARLHKARPGPRKPSSITHKTVKPAPSTRKVITRYDCPPPSSLPPGAAPIIPGVPYIGQPPLWGYPPGWIPTGPPETPHDFPPGLTIPPAGYPPGGYPPGSHPPAGTPPGFAPPVDVPEPQPWSVLLFGLALLMTRRQFSQPKG